MKKSSGTLYWGLSGNEPLAESNLSGTISKEFIFFGGKRIARLDLPGGAVHYYFSDHLGSSNVVTNSTGATIEEESDFYPFGGERILTDLLPDQRYKFTGKERDLETGLDYFGARYYSSSLGRFITPDEFSGGPVDAFSSNDPLPKSPLPYANVLNPQSLNKYSYAYSNPVRYIDPNGHQAVMRHERHPENAPKWTLDEIQLLLTPLGFIPGAGDIVDGVNAGISLLRGNLGDAAMDGFAAATGPLGNSASLTLRLSRISGKLANQIQTFKSFDALKAGLGSAGEGKVWHHIVEQSKLGQFRPEAIHNTANVVSVPKEVNQALNAYYSSKRPFTDGKTVREWLNGKSYKEQYEFGKARLGEALKGKLQ